MDSSKIDLGAGKVHTNSTFNHISKRQKLGTEVEDELTVVDDGTDVEDSAEDSDEARDSYEDSDGYQNSDEEEEAERRDQAMRSECVSCSEPHPDPEQLIEDIRLHGITRYCDFPSERDTNGWRVISDNWSKGICPDCKDDVLGSASSTEDEESAEEEEFTEDEDEDEDEDEEARKNAQENAQDAGEEMSTEHPTWRCGKHGLKLLGPYSASAALGLGIVMMPAQPFFRCPRQGHDGCTNQGGLRGANGYGCPPL